jgi:HSP20 family molecular chaperone IbpA
VDSSRIEARYQDGLLTVTLPKSEAARPRQITVAVQ